jgi:hypothetical protein
MSGSKKCGNCRFYVVTNHVIGGTENCSNIPQPVSGTEVKLKPVYYYEVCAKWEGTEQR